MKCNSRQLLFLLTAAVLFMFAHGAALQKKAFDEEIDEVLRTGATGEKNGQSQEKNMENSTHAQSHDRYCQYSNPCGWALYNDQITRQPDYYMRGSCVCPKGKECLRAEEDVSIAGFVYRCR